eukprot:904965-Pelagomonas_calceolata.AAC.6
MQTHQQSNSLVGLSGMLSFRSLELPSRLSALQLKAPSLAYHHTIGNMVMITLEAVVDNSNRYGANREEEQISERVVGTGQLRTARFCGKS